VPYKTNSELPKTVREKLPENGQDIYRKAFNSAWDIKNLPNKGEILQEKRLLTRLPEARWRKYMKQILKKLGKKNKFLIFETLLVIF
jgi:cation transport regulator